MNTILYVELLEGQVMLNAIAHCYMSYVMFAFIALRQSVAKLKRDANPKKVRGQTVAHSKRAFYPYRTPTPPPQTHSNPFFSSIYPPPPPSPPKPTTQSFFSPIFSLPPQKPHKQILGGGFLAVTLYGVFWVFMWRYAVAHNDYRHLFWAAFTFDMIIFPTAITFMLLMYWMTWRSLKR